jgi:hypothetical protein
MLWRVFSAPQTLLLLMGLLSLTLGVAAWVPQIPSQESSEAQAWLAAQPGLFGQENSFVRALGLHDLYHTFWFRLLLVLTGLGLFVRTVDAAELAWRATNTRGRAAMPPPWQSMLPVRRIAAPLPLAETAPRVEEYLTRCGCSRSELPASPASPAAPAAPATLRTLVAGQRAWALWLRPAGYAALLLSLLGLFLAGSWGWQDDPVQLLPGESRSVDHGTSLGFRLDGFRLHLARRGQLTGYESEITWLEDQAETGRAVAGIGRPARQGGVALHQAGFVPVVRLTAQDGAGRPLPLQDGSGGGSGGDEILIRFSLPEDQPLVFLSHLDRFLALTFEPFCALGRPVVHVDLLDEAGVSRQRLGSLSGNGTLPLGDGQLKAELAYVPILRLESRPALGLAFAAALLALLALALAGTLPARLAWLALLPAGVDRSEVEVAALTGAGQREWLERLAGGLEEALQHGD